MAFLDETGLTTLIQKMHEYYNEVEQTWAQNISDLQNQIADSSVSLEAIKAAWNGKTLALTDASISFASGSSSTSIGSGTAQFSDKVNAVNGFYQTSDETLKDFGKDIDIDFDELAKIPKKYFTWKKDTGASVKHIGTSAQEVAKIYPEVVKKDNDGMLSVDYALLSVIALAAVDKLYKEIEELKKK